MKKTSTLSKPAAKYWLVQTGNGRCGLAALRDGWLYVVAEDGTNGGHVPPDYDQSANEGLARILLSEIHSKAGVS